MKKLKNLILKNYIIILFLLFIICTYAQSGVVSLSTYYSAPQWIYDRLTLTPIDEDETELDDACADPDGQVGGMWIDEGSLITNINDDSYVNICVDGEWYSFNSGIPWVKMQSDANIVYLKDQDNPELKMVSIGTVLPKLKLTIEPDGGIGAFGQLDAGESLPDLESGARFIWYPRKGAIRAGEVTANQWDNANIGYHSVAFGKNTQAIADQSAILGGENNIVTTAVEYGIIGGGKDNNLTGSYGVGCKCGVRLSSSYDSSYDCITPNHVGSSAANCGTIRIVCNSIITSADNCYPSCLLGCIPVSTDYDRSCSVDQIIFSSTDK